LTINRRDNHFKLLKNINLPDEIALKEEIKEIADKIDAIINMVNQYYPMDQESNTAKNEKSDHQNI
jgi:Asp-tRNA(Asn)/Glu-tRNA(Gln) amidotransferase C subunit